MESIRNFLDRESTSRCVGELRTKPQRSGDGPRWEETRRSKKKICSRPGVSSSTGIYEDVNQLTWVQARGSVSILRRLRNDVYVAWKHAAAVPQNVRPGLGPRYLFVVTIGGCNFTCLACVINCQRCLEWSVCAIGVSAISHEVSQVHSALGTPEPIRNTTQAKHVLAAGGYAQYNASISREIY